jgi:2-polyprenyl-6-methoxyphenol hydroxylase-like FAD-dependent oxidoreductase
MASVVIVGAGPAGALLSYLLARRGVGVTLLERQTDFAREFRGEVLMPSGTEAIAQAGLLEKLDALAHGAANKIGIFRGDREVMTVTIDNPANGPRVTPQAPMLEMIVGEASRFPNFRLERGTTVRELMRENGRVVGVKADTHAGSHEFRADFVIGTDGRASIVRRQAGFAPDRVQQAFDVVWARVPGTFLDGRTARGYIGRGHLFIMYPSPEGHLQIGWVIKKGAFGDLRRIGAEGWLGEMAPHLSRDVVDFLEAGRASLKHPVLLDVVCDRVREWSAPGVMVIGDAAHTMSPVGAQGINIALRDTIVAANHLGAALASGAGPAELDEAARRVQAERIAEVAAIQDMQQFGPRILFANSILSPIMTSAPVIWFARTFLQRTLAHRVQPFIRGASKVRLEA